MRCFSFIRNAYLIKKSADLQAVDAGTWLVVFPLLISVQDQIINDVVAGEPAAINGMDGACLPNLLPVLYFPNEDVGKASYRQGYQTFRAVASVRSPSNIMLHRG